jgi:hypothetical protein
MSENRTLDEIVGSGKTVDEILRSANSRTFITAALARLMQRASLSRRQIAERATAQHVVGMSKTIVAEVISGRRPVPSMAFAVAFATYCRATDDEIEFLKETWSRVQHVEPPPDVQPSEPEPDSSAHAIPGQRPPALGRDTDQHLETLTVMAEVAGELDDPKVLPFAQRLGERVFAVRRELLGEMNEQTLNAEHNLGVVLGLLHDLPTACRLLNDVYLKRHSALGRTHPATLSSMESLASARFDLGERDTARKLLTECLARRREAVAESEARDLQARRAKVRSTAEKLLQALDQIGDQAAADEIRTEMSRDNAWSRGTD